MPSSSEVIHRRWEITRFSPPRSRPVLLPRIPPKTTFGGPRSAEGRRITAFINEIEPILTAAREATHSALGLTLEVGLPSATDLLTHHDLDNFLEPLATALASPSLCFVAARKCHGEISTLRLGAVERDDGANDGWQRASGRCGGVSSPSQRALARELASQADGVPWGPIQLDVAMRLGSDRNWVQAWKPVIDSLVPILGRRRGAREFDIEDGRVVALALHREVDPRLGPALEIEVRWRLLEQLQGGPSLTFDVREPPPPSPQTSSKAREQRHEAAATHVDSLAFEPIVTVERLRELREAEGFIIITDTAGPPRLHRASCAAINERFFVTKVIENRGRNGAYLFARSANEARARWPRLREHACNRGHVP